MRKCKKSVKMSIDSLVALQFKMKSKGGKNENCKRSV